MSATYNWAYRPGVANKYGLTVPVGADNIRPLGWCYVGLFGNDDTGNGSRQYPYKTLTKAAASTSGAPIFVIGSGIYRELAPLTINADFTTFIGDGDVVVDISYISFFVKNHVPTVFNVSFRGDGTSCYLVGDNYGGALTDCLLDGCALSNSGGQYGGALTGCIIKNCHLQLFSGSNGGINIITNCTFYNCSNLGLNNHNSPSNCIFVKCNIAGDVSVYQSIKYSLFHHCNFAFATGYGGAIYPNIPSGYSYYSDISALQSAVSSAFNAPGLNGCLIADPVFNNEFIGDLTISFSSPAKNLSFYGTYVGARSISYPLKVSSTENDGVFDFSTAINLNIADDSITLTDPAQDGVIETKVITNVLGRQLKSIQIYGFNADRNGQYIDSIADLDTSTKAAGDTLTVPASYIIEEGAINYNGGNLTAGQRFTTVSGQITFTTATGGVVREILEAPQRHTIEMMLSDVQPFTTETYNHFEPGITPTTNNVGDSRTGAILRGNGDRAYVRGSTVEFPVNTKYIKIRFTIRANNLKP
jgi:hypothetical protein